MEFVEGKTKINLPQFLASVFDFAITPACSTCWNLVGGTYGFCAACWHDFEFITPPICHRTGVPFYLNPPGLRGQDLQS